MFRNERGPEFKTLFNISEIFNDLLLFFGGGGTSLDRDRFDNFIIFYVYDMRCQIQQALTGWLIIIVHYRFTTDILEDDDTPNENIDQKRVLADYRI